MARGAFMLNGDRYYNRCEAKDIWASLAVFLISGFALFAFAFWVFLPNHLEVVEYEAIESEWSDYIEKKSGGGGLGKVRWLSLNFEDADVQALTEENQERFASWKSGNPVEYERQWARKADDGFWNGPNVYTPRLNSALGLGACTLGCVISLSFFVYNAIYLPLYYNTQNYLLWHQYREERSEEKKNNAAGTIQDIFRKRGGKSDDETTKGEIVASAPEADWVTKVLDGTNVSPIPSAPKLEVERNYEPVSTKTLSLSEQFDRAINKAVGDTSFDLSSDFAVRRRRCLYLESMLEEIQSGN